MIQRVNETEWTQLLQFLRTQLQEQGLGTIDADVFAAVRTPDGAGARDTVLSYLEALEYNLRLQSSSSVDQVVDRLGNVAGQARGGRITDVVVTLEGPRRIVAGRQEVSLRELPNLDDRITAVNYLRLRLMES